MKKGIMSLFVLLLVGINITQAQVAHWIIPPYFDSIYFATGTDFIVTDSLNETSVWTQTGTRLFKTTDKLHPFSEGIAVTTEPNSEKITGFFTVDGNFTLLENCNLAHGFPFFCNGFLLVKCADGYHFADTKGKLTKSGILSAYPFSNGYSSCIEYKNKEKRKTPFPFLINNNKLKIPFTINGKTIPDEDVEFVSSINDEGFGIVVVKHKLYFFEGEGKDLRPVLAGPDETDLRQQAKLSGKLSECLMVLDNSTCTLYANCGKTDQISILFDSRMIPVEIRYNTNKHSYEKMKPERKRPVSQLVKTEKKGLFGVSSDGKIILPEQFEAINDCFANNAFVKMKGKQGLICITKEYDFLATINSGKKICFRHGTVDTRIHIEMPTFIPSERTTIESRDTSCVINKTSWVPKKTPQGNSIEYECSLKFPNELYKHTLLYPDNPKQQTIKVKYPIRITSDGILFPEINLEADVWYHKYITIDLNESDKAVNKGVGLFTFDIKAEIISDDDFSPLEVRIVADSSYLEPQCEQLPSNNRRYRGTVYNLKEGPNDIVIEILEEGCPPIQYPHTITYTKPSAKNKHKKENIDIKKKTEEETSDEPIFDL